MSYTRPAEVFPPGDFLREELEARGWSQMDFAEIIGRPRKAVSEILAGKRQVTPDTATELAAALGTSPEYWLRLEALYQLGQVSAHDTSSVSRRAKLYEKVPVRDIVRRGWVEHSDNIDVLECRVLAFLGITDIEDEPVLFPHAARKSSSYADVTPAQAAWLIRARHLAKYVHAEGFSKQKLRGALTTLRDLVHAPQETRQVSRVLGDAGVRLVIVEPLPGGKIDGATFWLDEHSPVVALALRFDRLDNFWFTLLHELKHVERGESRLDTEDEGTLESERLADRGAGEYFISADTLDSFVATVGPLYHTDRIIAFAHTMQVHPAIVVGQLQHRGAVAWASFRKLLVPMREFVTTSTVTDGWGAILPPQ